MIRKNNLHTPTCIVLSSILIILTNTACAPSVRSSTNKANQPATTSKFLNPVLNQDFADPTAIRAVDGYYYAYATNTRSKDGKMINMQVAKSKDLVIWETLGDALPQRPTWANKDYWAPHVSYDNKTKKYYMYYSGESLSDSIGKCLGVAISDSPAGPFVDKGSPLLCGETFVNIDPMAFDDPVTGKKLLYWGSAFKPIKVQELDDDRINFKAGSAPSDVVHPVINSDPSNYQKLIEGAWLVYRNKYYYLYFSGDNCCGERAHYAVMVARSKSALGPFESKLEGVSGKHTVILEKNTKWIAPGHNSIVDDAIGHDWIVYHAIDSSNRKGGRVMLIDKIVYKEGWPSVGNGTPSVDSTQSPF